MSLHNSGDFICHLQWLGLVIKILDIQMVSTCGEYVSLTQNFTMDAWEKGHLTLYIHSSNPPPPPPLPKKGGGI